MKKTVSILLAAVLLLTVIPAAAAEEITLPVHVQGSIFGGGGHDSIAVELRFDPDWIIGGDGTEYDRDLAAFCALLSADSYFRTKDLDRGTPNRVVIDGTDPDAYAPTALLSAVGFTDVRYIESFKAGTYDADTNDSVTMLLAYGCFQGCDCYVFVIRGCFSSGEWYSIFDVGAEGEAYTELTGAHPEWTEPAQMKGLNIAANRAMAFIGPFMAEHDDPAQPDRVLVTGHSRGGCIAEILGARFEDDPGIISRTYTFNAAPVTADPAAESYRTVFNIFDSADFFSDCLPFPQELFYRYGRTLSLPVADSPEILAAIAAVKGTDDYRCLPPEVAGAFTEYFGRLFPNRASLYAPQTAVFTFEGEKEAADARENCRALIGAQDGLGLDAFCFVSDVCQDADGQYAFSLTYAPAGQLECVGRVLAYGQTASDAVHVLFAGTPELCALADLIMANAADITGGHRLLNSYVLTGFVAP